jgi:hypothetical protein
MDEVSPDVLHAPKLGDLASKKSLEDRVPASDMVLPEKTLRELNTFKKARFETALAKPALFFRNS